MWGFFAADWSSQSFSISSERARMTSGSEEDLLAVLMGGPWIIQDHLLSLQRWRDNFDPSTATFEITPVWLRFPNLPLDFWDGLTLTEIAAFAGTPI
ncbi:hypothetical protein QJS10_CPA09g00564 [Acorus calamus]|uniref:DUF4283 domain-containing protein n=1 Tax=Acorus calamus TaxID=4465 RepID=A0AAV9EB34_ACOCL|nr:hypothetical protein QJS10_CPA09g00564 [Acorus calamus]